MSEPKIEPLIPLIRRGLNIPLSFLFRPTPPNLFPSRILPNIIPLCKSIQHYIHSNNRKQNFITPPVIRCVVSAVDIRRHDIAKLYHHVVEG